MKSFLESIALAAVFMACTLPPLSTGCSTSGGAGAGGINVTNLITPARIEAVTALGAYAGGKAAIADGHRAEIEQALAALETVAAAERVDLAAVAVALEAAGIGHLSSGEGALIVGMALSFADLWAGTAQPVLEGEQARAAVRGLVRGFRLALGPATRSALDGHKVKLQADAVATRPAR